MGLPILLAVFTFSIVPRTAAQLVELREYRGQQIACARSGLHSFEMPCGIETWYEDIFIGTVLSVTEVSETERTLRIAPGEVFLGNPGRQLTATTSQGACLPELRAGDDWLFYLRRDAETKELVLSYGSPSGPIDETQKTIALLRRLIRMTNTGVIHGFVGHPVVSPDGSEEWTYPANHKIVAKRVEDGIEYVASSDRDGNYEFEPLAVGSYDLTANTTQGLWAEVGSVDVQPRGCSFVGFEFHPDGMISGRVTTAAGEPLSHAEGWITQEDGKGPWRLLVVDEQGYFQARGLAAGRYLVWLEIQDNQGHLGPPARVYYPGVRDKNLAVVVELGPAEKRSHIDFHVPSSTAR